MYFLFDIGGTNIRLCLTNDFYSELDVLKVPTPDSFEDGMNLIASYLEEKNAIGNIEMTVGGTTGVMNQHKNKLINAMHLSNWNNKPLKNEISKIVQGEVLIENDSALATLGEAVDGVGKDYEIVVYITVSTGLGGSRVVNKVIEKSNLNFEIGHQIIDVDGEVRYLEDLVSGSGLERRYKQKPENVTDLRIWNEMEFYLAVGLNNILVHWSPDIVIIGGAIGRRLNLNNVRDRLKQVMRIYPELPVIQRSELRHNGIHGARYLLQNL